MNKIINLLFKTSNFGVKAETTQSEARHIQFANYCSLISIIAIFIFCTFDSIIAFNQLKEPIFISLLYIPLLILTLYLNKKELYTASRNLLAFSCISLTFIIAAFYFGRDAREHSLFILFAVIAFIVNPIRKWRTVLVVGIICALAFTYIEVFVDPSSVKTPYPAEYVNIYKIFTNLFAFFTFIIILVIYEVRITQKETLLESYTRGLEEINKGLIQINDEARMSHDLLVKMNSKKDEMFSIIAHDLRSPIGNILVSSDILSRSIQNEDKKTTEIFMESIREASQNTFSLLEDLLTWATTQIGRIRYNPSDLELPVIIREVIPYLQSNIEKKNLKLKADDNNVGLYADHNMIKTVLRNLISNAIKFSRQNGVIQIFSKSTETGIEITVKDSGVGMSEDRIDEFLRGGLIKSQPGTFNEKGTGFGLLICKELIEKNKGHIRIHTIMGKGTEITVILPKNV